MKTLSFEFKFIDRIRLTEMEINLQMNFDVPDIYASIRMELQETKDE